MKNEIKCFIKVFDIRLMKNCVLSQRKDCLKEKKKNFNKAQIGKYIADMGYLKRRIQINGLRKLYYFNVVNKLNV